MIINSNSFSSILIKIYHKKLMVRPVAFFTIFLKLHVSFNSTQRCYISNILPDHLLYSNQELNSNSSFWQILIKYTLLPLKKKLFVNFLQNKKKIIWNLYN